MRAPDETMKTNYSTYGTEGEERHENFNQRVQRPATASENVLKNFKFFRHMKPELIPSSFEDDIEERSNLSHRTVTPKYNVIENRSHTVRGHRGLRRRLFLFLTEPSSSWLSAIFFLLLIIAIFMSNLVIIMQTMSSFQYRPTECQFCGEDGGFSDFLKDYKTATSDVLECVCPLEPLPYLDTFLGHTLQFFAIEWTLRVLSYVPAHPDPNIFRQFGAWLAFLTWPTTLLDALAIWPYFIEFDLPGLMSLRLLRLLRVFQLFRLGSYNSMFVSLTNVLYKSIGFFKLLIVTMFFGATIFGTLLFWLEQGEWKYWEPTGDFQYIRVGKDGNSEEISPFCSIPSAFWWFIVTATTVGYGDYVPTSTAGQWVSACAMLTGVLVIAFPVSIFSDLWSEELKEVKGLESLFDDDSYEDNAVHGSIVNEEQKHEKIGSSPEAQRFQFQNTYQKVNLEEDYQSQSSTRIAIEVGDLNEIISSIHSINEKQRRIQRILRKYHVNEDDRL